VLYPSARTIHFRQRDGFVGYRTPKTLRADHLSKGPEFCPIGGGRSHGSYNGLIAMKFFD
jgi:hypothetical protein